MLFHCKDHYYLTIISRYILLFLLLFLEMLHCAKTGNKGRCEGKIKNYSRPILLQHYPLYRQSDTECNDEDAAPYPIKVERFRENWECLSKVATTQLLKQIQPRLALSGHTHHGCTRTLESGDGIEITIPSFSWRNKKNPTFGLVRKYTCI